MPINKFARVFLLITNFFNGIAGIVCGLLFIMGPDGRYMGVGDGGLIQMMQNFPLAYIFFRNFTWTGIAMLLVLGIPSTIAALSLLRQTATQYKWAFISSRLLMLWCFIEAIFLPNYLVIFFMLIGVIQLVLVVRAMNSGKLFRKKV